MNNLGTVEIETERLLLRRFKKSDAADMFDNWASDNEVTKYLTWPSHSEIDVSKIVIDSWIRSYADEKSYLWAIELKSIGQVIGSISVVDYKENIESVEIGYCIGRIFWKSGYTSEALKALIEFFFNEVRANRVESRHDPRNCASGKVMLKCGMTYEGTRIMADKNNTGICDVAMYGIVKNTEEPSPLRFT